MPDIEYLLARLKSHQSQAAKEHGNPIPHPPIPKRKRKPKKFKLKPTESQNIPLLDV